MMPKVTINIVFALALLVGLPNTLANSTTKVAKTQATGLGHELGRIDFVAYCAACHGVSGKGDGTVAEFLTITAVDLTQLRKMNAGSFPRERIHNVIDGRAEVKIHGARDMPVWGGWFEFEADASVAGKGAKEEVVLERINALVNYIESIQEN
jgi:mono/diheme cytochrome c family protein